MSVGDIFLLWRCWCARGWLLVVVWDVAAAEAVGRCLRAVYKTT